MDDVGRFIHDVVCYCATCRKNLGLGKNEYLGREFVCPNKKSNDDKHLARLILKEDPAFWWLDIEWFLYRWQNQWSQLAILKRVYKRCGWKQPEAELFVGTWFAILIGALMTAKRMSSFAINSCIIFCILMLWHLLDIFLVNISITFTTKFPANRLRTVMLTLAGYIQVALTYAYFYSIMGEPSFHNYKSVLQAVYFSFGTIITVGYGDMQPMGLIPHLIVISELIVGLFFVAIIIANVASWVNQSSYPEGELEFSQVHKSLDVRNQ